MKKVLILVTVLVSILVSAGCTSEATSPATPTPGATATPFPTPTPTLTPTPPTPTSTPPPSPLVPIVVAEGATRHETMAQVPAGEVECVRQTLGEAAFGQFSASAFSEDTSEAENQAMSRCLSNESISRFFIGFAVSGLGGISDATIACMGDALSGHDMKATFSSETAWGEAFQAMTGCLNGEESARADAGGFFGGAEEEPGSPGLVDVGGRQIYLTCQGEGSPTVVMESGGRGHSGGWHLVQPFVAGFTRVCAYDRAGTGRSESVPLNDTAQEIADELHNLLATAEIEGPYVLVGHSLGGILVRVFANRYLNEVAGMVLVGTGHGDPQARREAVLTAEEWRLVREVTTHADEGFTLPGGLSLLGPDLGDNPLVVLTAGNRGASPLSQDIVERLEQVHQEMQKELLDLSSNSTHIIAEESGHSIQKDQPDLVIAAIRSVVEQAVVSRQPGREEGDYERIRSSKGFHRGSTAVGGAFGFRRGIELFAG